MDRYTQREGTPMTFHKVFQFAILPLEVISALITVYDLTQSTAAVSYLTLIDYGYCFLMAALCVVCFIGFMKWKPYGWYGVMALLGMDLAYSLWRIGVYALYLPAGIELGILEFLLTAFMSVLVGIYYLKRRLLFSGRAIAAPAGEKKEEPVRPEPMGTAPQPGARLRRAEPVKEDRSGKRYCTQCGGEVSGAGERCPHCGAPRLKRQD